jgi:tRNA G18 (ribose-2'-O)-methylase SpoU
MVSQIYLLLHNIRSTHNVGSIFRTADAALVSKIYISGYTPTPIDRFGRNRSDISKVSLGAEKEIPWEYIKDPKELIKNLKKEKVEIISLEQNPKSIDYREVRLKGNTLIVLGNEVGGVEEDLLNLSDQIVEIPMYGTKESLNVSVALGILLFQLRK